MFKLILDRGDYLRVRRGVTAKDIEGVYRCPVLAEIFNGAIVTLPHNEFEVYAVRVGESFKSISQKINVSEEELIRLNGKVIYPTKKIYLPKSQT
jgi:hypothetical protein